MSAKQKMHKSMDFDAWREAWYDLCRERGHVLKMDSDFGGVDQFVTSGGYCNGPGCANCGWSACMHCDSMGDNIPMCSKLSAVSGGK